MSLASLLLLTSMLYVTTCDVYIVTPDDHRYPNTTCHHCHNLQHYVLNVSKYFTSNTQLLLLPGQHYLYSDLTIENVHNFSLIGSATEYIPANIVYCNSSDQGMLITNSTAITVKNLVITKCEFVYRETYEAFVEFFNCHHVQLHNLSMDVEFIGYNIMGNSILSHLTSASMYIIYDDNVTVQTVYHQLKINYYLTDEQTNINKVVFHVAQLFYRVSIVVTNSVFAWLSENDGLIIPVDSSCATHYENEIIFNRTQFSDNNDISYIIYVTFSLKDHCSNGIFSKQDKIVFNDCIFAENFNISQLLIGEWLNESINIKQSLIIMNCTFKNNAVSENYLCLYSLSTERSNNIILMVNTDFISNTIVRTKTEIIPVLGGDISLVDSHMKLYVIGPVKFYNNTCDFLFALQMDSYIIFHGYVEFLSNNKAYALIFGSESQYIKLFQTVVFNISRNIIHLKLFHNNGYGVLINPSATIPTCYFQFYGHHSQADVYAKNIFEIIIAHTNAVVFDENIKNINCKMLSQSLFYKHNPLIIYQQFIHIVTDYGHLPHFFDTGILCYCYSPELQKCNINTLGPVFPGQTLVINLCINHKVKYIYNDVLVSIQMYDDSLPKSHCKVNIIELKRTTRNITKLNYTVTVLSNNEKQCELFFTAKGYKYFTIFYVRLLTCPMGFALDINTEKCECDVSMQSRLLKIKHCNINDQTVLRPGDSWMTAETYNNSHIYHISPKCPFHYCLPQSSYLNFSTPNTQCQFNRYALLCGQC